jgi:predicted O-linked N-acetylglucosamine transferase (SPINDLY family)
MTNTIYLNEQIIEKICKKDHTEQMTKNLIAHIIKENENKSPAEQRAEYLRLLYFAPLNVELHFSIAVTYIKTGNLDEGRSFLSICLALNPNHVPSLLELAIIYRSFNNAQSIMLLEKAHGLELDNMSVLNTLGVLYVEVNRFEDALRVFKHVLEICTMKLNKEEVLDETEKLKIKDIKYKVYGNLATLSASMGHNKEALEYIIESESLGLCTAHLQTKFLIMNYLYPDEIATILKKNDSDPFVTIYKEHLLVNKTVTNKNAYNFKDRKQNAKIRVGYVSSDFRNHVVAKFLNTIMTKYNTDKFEVYCYYTYKAPDKITDVFKQHTNFKNIHIMSTQEASKLIYDDNIDILVDLNGNTSGSRFDIFAMKPAPIQVTYLGYPNTSGLLEMDYRITDSVADPLDTKQRYVEKLLRIDTDANTDSQCSFINYSTSLDFLPENAYELKLRDGLCEDSRVGFGVDGTVIFGAINRPPKNSALYLECVRKILHEVPNAKLLIKGNSVNEDPSIKENLLKTLQIPEDRLIVLNYITDQSLYNQLYNKIDILLDTFPYSGTTTSCDCLYMSTPVITMKGPVHSHNVTASIVSRIPECSDEFIANDATDYVAKAVSLANNMDRIKYYKTSLRDLFVKSQDPVKFMNAYESLLEKICK